ncbi:MAG: D-cysteine desulfhydrase family protein [Candidatus Aminicenantes bacterium]
MKYSIQELEKKVKKFQRKKLLYRPTPISSLSRLSKYLKGPHLFIKREDLAGLALGGNKTRKLEYIIQDVMDNHSDVIITWGSVQSNWCLQTAAAARKYGIKPILLLFKTYEIQKEMDGNLLLDFILDADIRIMEAKKGRVVKAEDVEGILEEILNEIKEWRHKAYIAPIGGSLTGFSMKNPLGTLAYVDAYLELKKQMKSINKDIDYIILASGSGSTQAGLIAGAKLCGDDTKILGISVSEERESFSYEIKKITKQVGDCLGLKMELTDKDIIVLDDYIGEGYGVLNEKVSQAIRLMAIKEGIFIDPIYTGKAFSALIDLIKKGTFKKGDNILFMHTGGTSALFPHKQGIKKFLYKK